MRAKIQKKIKMACWLYAPTPWSGKKAAYPPQGVRWSPVYWLAQLVQTAVIRSLSCLPRLSVGQTFKSMQLTQPITRGKSYLYTVKI